MDLPSVCPYCDSVEMNYTYLWHLDPREPARLVFTCRTCGSHVESDVTDFEPPVDDPRWTIATIPAHRTEQAADPASERSEQTSSRQR